MCGVGAYRKVMRVPTPSQVQMIEKIEQKKYLHFDAFLKKQEILRIVSDPEAVAKNAFYPFLGYVKKTGKFSASKEKRKGKPRKQKDRDIRYASRRDAAIFQTYRQILLPYYEERLKKAGIDDVAIAYRKIPVPDRPQAGKCNIHHAYDVFAAIQKSAPCLAIALDISGFFEHIDHSNLYSLWCELLNVVTLPKDHLKVFKSITSYSVIDLQEALNVVPRPENPKQVQLCSPSVFREKIAPLAKRNPNSFGIPQGSPISDLMANLSLINFDVEINSWIKKMGGMYKRYSDDIVLILPVQKNDDPRQTIQNCSSFVDAALFKAGEELKVKGSKTCCGCFETKGNEAVYTPIQPPSVSDEDFKNKPFEYLGFSFDGKRVLFRNSTVSGFYRKLTGRTHLIIQEVIRRYPNKSIEEIRAQITPDLVIERFLKIQDFYEKANEYENWTFWSYAKRSHEIMSKGGSIESGIIKQLTGFRKKIQQVIADDLEGIYGKIKRSPSKGAKKRAKKQDSVSTADEG